MNPTRPAQASFRDRTYEFGAAVESTRRQSSAPAAASSSSTGSLDGLIAATSARSEFNNRASKIGLGIHQTSQKLSRLAKYLQAICNSQNESGSLSKDTTNHSTTIVDNLKNRLMSAMKEFKEVLTMRTENLKVHENRRQMFSFSSSAAKDASNPFIRCC
ncbi:unnamed protein product [Miscanthus lutarioriparius]|uniref:Syntaxin-5 N-terminal Sly1p-binding domain-containing protein n=1 Tax=Miscanthus lutarioriparius TaxID=422564 RepID=A0A811PD33_9POAL|nr:unnamed protein product [Miscanthus lutarioriparius]